MNRRWTALLSTLMVLAGPSCATTASQKSTGTNWLTCNTAADCAPAEGAACNPQGICVDATGHPISKPGASQLTDTSDWLAICTSDADCGGSFHCWCGVCTELCASTADCRRLSSAAICSDTSTASAVCGPHGGPILSATACVLPCVMLPEPVGVQPCAALGSNASCFSDGICRQPSKTTPATDGGFVTCSQVSDNMGALISAAAARHQHCSTNADCTAIPDSNECFGDCAATVSRAEASAFSDEIANLGKQYCGSFVSAGCQTLRLSCPAEQAECVDGVCQGCEVSCPRDQ